MPQDKDQSRAGNYRLEVSNFGPIARANVDFRPLTIFVGPSNTGKSYLAMLLYVIHLCLAGSPSGKGGIGRPRWRESAWPSKRTPETRRRARQWGQWVRKALSAKAAPPLPQNIVEQVQGALEKPKRLGDAFAQELHRCFGVKSCQDLVRVPCAGKQALVRLAVPLQKAHQSLSYALKIGAANPRVVGDVPLQALSLALSETTERELAQIEEFGEVDEMASLSHMMNRAIPGLIGDLGRKAYYLPADRTGVMHSHELVVSALVQGASLAGLRPMANGPTLSGVLADFFNQLLQFRPDQRLRKSRIQDLGCQLERNVLQGAVQVETSEANYPSFLFRPHDWETNLPLMRVSSMVSELAPLVLYLRHAVRPGDVLIIEEPEAHLHPAMQTALARELARLVGLGVRILMTTHSEWLLEQIGNLVRLSSLGKAQRAGIEGAETPLKAQDVGAWLFRPAQRPKGTVVEEVQLDPETGLFPTDYDAVGDALYNAGAKIHNRLQESKGK